MKCVLLSINKIGSRKIGERYMVQRTIAVGENNILSNAVSIVSRLAVGINPTSLVVFSFQQLNWH